MESPNDSAAAMGAHASPGALLAAERERQSLSRADVAQRVHMSVTQIEALENGDYGRLPRGTFLRGFVRNYAKSLGLDPEAVARALSESAPRDPKPGLVVATQNIRFDPIGERLASPLVRAVAIAAVLVILGFFAMYWWLFIRPSPPGGTAGARKPVVAEAPKAVAPAPAEKVVAPAEAGAPSMDSGLRRNDEARAIDPAPVIAAGGSVIRFKFRGTSWVEIKDGRGKVLLSRINPGGSEAEVVGKPPFSVVVGNAPDVKMYYNDREFDLEPHTRVAVARFTVD